LEFIENISGIEKKTGKKKAEKHKFDEHRSEVAMART
jgi:hypothetical protein